MIMEIIIGWIHFSAIKKLIKVNRKKKLKKNNQMMARREKKRKKICKDRHPQQIAFIAGNKNHKKLRD